MKVVFTPASEADLMDIALYTAEDNPTRAISFAAESEATRKLPGDMPSIGRARQALRGECVHWRAATT